MHAVQLRWRQRLLHSCVIVDAGWSRCVQGNSVAYMHTYIVGEMEAEMEVVAVLRCRKCWCGALGARVRVKRFQLQARTHFPSQRPIRRTLQWHFSCFQISQHAIVVLTRCGPHCTVHTHKHTNFIPVSYNRVLFTHCTLVCTTKYKRYTATDLGLAS